MVHTNFNRFSIKACSRHEKICRGCFVHFYKGPCVLNHAYYSQKWHILHQYFKNKELNAVIWCKIDALKRDQNLHSAYYFWPELKYFPARLDTYLWKVTDAFSIIFMQWSIIKKLWNRRIIINMYKICLLVFLLWSLDSPPPEQNLFLKLFRHLYKVYHLL